jgi:uncharacterized protein (DUF305 family)
MSERHVTGPRPPGRYSLVQLVVAGVACALLGAGVSRALDTGTASPTAVDVGFAQDMIDHHDQAMSMSLKLMAKPDIDRVVWSFASEVLIFQRWETGILDTHLAEWGHERGAPDRVTMRWMGMGVPVAQMPGMQPPQLMEELEAASGAEAARLFLTMMRDHHLGGVHMAEFAAEHADDGDIRDLAARMARNQRVEANEYSAQLVKLGGS